MSPGELLREALRAELPAAMELRRELHAQPCVSGKEGPTLKRVLDALSGKQVYKVRVGGGGQTFSASPIGVGHRVLLLTEEGTTFVLDSGAEYKEIAKNDLGEMSLASPAVAGDAIYIRTETKLYKIAS